MHRSSAPRRRRARGVASGGAHRPARAPSSASGTCARPLPVRHGRDAWSSARRPGRAICLSNFPELLPHFTPGELVLVDDGAVAFRVSAVTPPTVVRSRRCNDGVDRVAQGRQPAGYAAADQRVSPTHDRELLAWGLGAGHRLRRALVRALCRRRDASSRSSIAAAGGDQFVVAKIEKKEALADYEEIIAAADAVMVARGDLGVEIDPSTGAGLAEAHHPRGQRRREAGHHGDADARSPWSPLRGRRAPRRATSPTPSTTRPAPSCSRARPRSAATRWRRCARWPRSRSPSKRTSSARARAPQPWAAGRTGVSNAISYGACEVAQRVGAAAIVTATFSGATARAVARNLPAQPIVAVSPNQRVVNQLALSWGVSPAARRGLRGSFEEIVLRGQRTGACRPPWRSVATSSSSPPAC